MSQVWYYSKNGADRVGPISKEELFGLAGNGEIDVSTLVWNPAMAAWSTYGDQFGMQPSPKIHPVPSISLDGSESPVDVANRIANFEIASLVLWAILSLIQIFIIAEMPVILVGFYNTIIVVLRVPHITKIKQRKNSVVGTYAGMVGLVIAAIANGIFGAYLGVILVLFDFYIRHMVMENKKIFVQ